MDFDSTAEDLETNRPKITTKKSNRILLYDELMLFVAVAISCLAVVLSSELSDHPSYSFSLLGVVGLTFQIFASYCYSSKQPKLNPFGFLLAVIWFWLLWDISACLRNTLELHKEKVVFNLFSEADVWIFVSCLLSEVISVFASAQGNLILFAVNWSTFFAVHPPISAGPEIIKIQVFLVYVTRYLILHHVRRFFLPGYREFFTDYTLAISGFWILISENFLVIVSGILVCVVCQLIPLTMSELIDKKKN
jgi:hypothetical protein